MKPDPLDIFLDEAKMVSLHVTPFSFQPHNDKKRPDKTNKRKNKQ
jgi:hypothetical protein